MSQGFESVTFSRLGQHPNFVFYILMWSKNYAT